MWTKSLIKTCCLLAATCAVEAAPLDKTRISSDAKWVIHLDVAKLRSSALGTCLINDVLKPALADMDEIKGANLSINFTNISSITGYGSSVGKDGDGVLLISTSANVKKDLDTVAGMFLLSAGTNAPFSIVELKPYPLYSFSRSLFFAPLDNGLYIGKSPEQIAQAHQVALGKAPNASARNHFKYAPESANGFLFVSVSDGFTGDAGMPPQAQILREAKGGQLSLGQKGDNAFINLVFQGKDDMASVRIQQVLQGLVALVSLSQQDSDITQLAGATRIAAEGQNVLVNVEYPIEKTIKRIKKAASDSQDSRQRKHAEHQGQANEERESAGEEKPPR